MAEESTKLVPALAHELDPGPGKLPAITGGLSPVDPRGQLFFSRYQEDGSLRLYKKGSMLGDDPAGYADMEVTVKVLVQRPGERFMVCLPVTRQQLAHPNAEQWLAEKAWEHRS